MKRIFILILALMLIALPSLAEPMTGLAFTTGTAEDGSLMFYFEDLSLRLPADWQEKVLAEPSGNSLAFYHRASYEKYLEEGLENGGFLFSLGASVNSSFSELPAFEYLGFSEISCMNYYLELPSDYPAYMGDEAVRAEYDAMYAQIGQIAQDAVIYGEDTAAPQDDVEATDDTAPQDDVEATDDAGQGNQHL